MNRELIENPEAPTIENSTLKNQILHRENPFPDNPEVSTIGNSKPRKIRTSKTVRMK
jgi:hypothetical protein